MSIEQLKKEVYYYTGKQCSDEEAEEIMGYAEDYPHVSLDEIISDYFNR
jgi:hypothetical protein